MISRITLFVIILLFQISPCFSQVIKTAQEKDIAKKEWELRNYTVYTCFQSKNLENIILKTRENLRKDTSRQSDFVPGNIKLANADFESLTPREKFIYAHQSPESYMQVCGLYDMAKDMSMLYANIPYLFDGERMSERQIKSLQVNRDSTMAYLSKCVNFNSHIPLGYKRTLLEINAWEFIPSILELEDKINSGDKEAIKDPYVYSLLMVLMKDNEFKDFKKTGIYKTLYGPGTGYRQKMSFTAATRDQLRALSEKFYLQKTGETK